MERTDGRTLISGQWNSLHGAWSIVCLREGILTGSEVKDIIEFISKDEHQTQGGKHNFLQFGALHCNSWKTLNHS